MLGDSEHEMIQCGTSPMAVWQHCGLGCHQSTATKPCARGQTTRRRRAAPLSKRGMYAATSVRSRAYWRAASGSTRLVTMGFEDQEAGGLCRGWRLSACRLAARFCMRTKCRRGRNCRGEKRQGEERAAVRNVTRVRDVMRAPPATANIPNSNRPVRPDQPDQPDQPTTNSASPAPSICRRSAHHPLAFGMKGTSLPARQTAFRLFRFQSILVMPGLHLRSEMDYTKKLCFCAFRFLSRCRYCQLMLFSGVL